MKRSQMLSYIAKIIETSGATIGSTHIDYNALAEDVLDAIEEQGMLPPEIQKMIPDNDFGCIEEGYKSILVNKWEDEA